jgi:hypothetical protein
MKIIVTSLYAMMCGMDLREITMDIKETEET